MRRRLDPHARFDVSLQAARERIADLHAVGGSPGSDPGDLPVAGAGRRWTRARDVIGLTLISLGASVVVDEGIRRRALRP